MFKQDFSPNVLRIGCGSSLVSSEGVVTSGGEVEDAHVTFNSKASSTANSVSLLGFATSIYLANMRFAVRMSISCQLVL